MKKLFALLSLIWVYSTSNSQIVKYINLAEGTVKLTEPIEHDKKIQIKILNRCKLNEYEILIRKISSEIDPINLGNTTKAMPANPTPCDELEEKYNAILSETDESKLPSLRKRLNELIRTTPPTCDIRSNAIELENSVDITYTIEPLKKGEILEVIIRRQKPSAKEWTATFNTGSKGVWRTSYGFALVSNAFSKEGKYYLDDSNRITKENNRTKVEFIPGIFFNWFPSSRALNSFSYGLSGGVGVNFNVEPVVFLGGSATYHHNISINIGLIGYNQSFLKGRYSEGEIINENNFDEESGLHQRLFRINPFVGISFRFGENPFKTPNDD